MINTVYIININGDVFQEIKYNNFNNISEKITSLISKYDEDIHFNYEPWSFVSRRGFESMSSKL